MIKLLVGFYFISKSSTCFGRQSHPSSGVHMLYMMMGEIVALNM